VPKHAAIGFRVRALAAALVACFVLLGRPDAASAQTPPPTESPEPSPSPTPEAPPPPPPPPSPTPAPTSSGDVDQADPAEPAKQWSAKNGPPKSGPRGSAPRVRRPHRRPPEDDCAALTGEVPYLGPAMDTGPLQEILARGRRFGFGPGRAMLTLGGPFPVAGPSSWSNDWHARRCEPYPHLHEGIDIFAPSGTPLVAVASGRVTQVVSAAISGLSVEITDAGGTQFYYAHLTGFAPDLRVGEDVEMGDVLGYVGTTGNARGTSPHLHLEVQPGGVPVPPKPYVDRWLEISERRASSWIASLKDGADGPAALRPDHRPAMTGEAGPSLGEIGWSATAALDTRDGVSAERWPGLIVLVAALGGALGPRIRSRRRRRPDPRPRRPKARRPRARRNTPRRPKERRPRERPPKARQPKEKARRRKERRPKARQRKVPPPKPSRRRPAAWVPVTGLAGARPSTADPEPTAVRPPAR
jgi:murein DD-endopeptidase MepM/ murein hydrolase activator NlpD